MTATTTTLPTHLATFASQTAEWALATQNERQHKRLHSSREALKSFYTTALPVLQDILNYVDQFPVGEIPPEGQPVFYIALSLAEVAPHIELYRGDPKVPFSFEEARFVADHGAVVG